MSGIERLDLKKYKLIIFDWDGTLVDSLCAYEAWDKLYVERFYDINLPVEYFKELANKIKKVNPGHSEDEYFRFLDKKFGTGKTPIEEIWKNIYTLAPEIQSEIKYKKWAPEALKSLRLLTDANITLATNSERRDIIFFSSKNSSTARYISPINYFDKIITLDDIDNPKPHPESFQKMINHFSVSPSEVLIFEDSSHGIMAAKSTGADIVLFNDGNFDHSELVNTVNYSINDWKEIVELISGRI